MLKPATTPDSDLLRLIPFVKIFDTTHGQVTVYVCRNHTCEIPTTNPTEVVRLLEQAEVPWSGTE